MHDQIVGRGLMPDVHDQNTGSDGVRLPLEIGLHQPGPALFFRAGHLGIAVSRQVHQIRLLVDEKIVDVGGLSRRGAHIGQILSAYQTVDHRGFSHVGAAREGKLGQTVPQEVLGLSGGAHKLRFIEIQRHTSLPLLP